MSLNPFRCISLFVVLLCVASGLAAPKRVLFVGNSYTHYENMTRTVEAFARARKIPLETQMSTTGGATLEQHWNGEKGNQKLDTLELIESGAFDLVVMQEQSLRPIESPEKMWEFSEKLGDSIKKSGSRAVFYMTWCREKTPETQSILTQNYEKAARLGDGIVAPVGLAWELARERRPGIQLYSEDGSHPSRLGAYLTACVFFSVVTGESCEGLPSRTTSKDAEGQFIFLTRIAKEDARFLKAIADETLKSYVQPGDR